MTRALRRRLTGLTAFAVALIAAPGPAAPQSAPRASPAESYTRENWTVADGLPINSITALLQTRDGYLWLGTNDGVVRFDGVRFTVYNAGNTPELPSNRITALHEDRAGALWILTEQQHLVRYLRGRFTRIDAKRGLRGGALQLTESPDGTLMLTTTRGAGILEDEHFTPIVESLEIENGYGGAVRRRDGSTWIATPHHGLWRVVNGRLEDVTPPALRGMDLLRVALDPHGRLWLSSTYSVWIEDGGFREVRRPDGPVERIDSFHYDTRGNRMWMRSRYGVDVATGAIATSAIATSAIATSASRFTVRSVLYWPAITLDSSGTAWYANGPELFHDGSRVAALDGTPGDNLTAGAIQSVAIDREGSIWLGTRASGLYRLKPSVFSVISVREGLRSGNVYPVYEDPWGSVWVGALEQGVSRIDGGGSRVTNFPLRGTSPSDDYPANPRDFFADRPDRLWVAALDGIRSCTLPAFRCTRDRSPALAGSLDVHALYPDTQGRLWAGTGDGVLRNDSGRWERVAGWPLNAIQVRAFANAPDGALWIATGGGGLVRYRDGRFARVSVADGLPSDVVRALYVDPDGYLWIGTEGRGLGRLDTRAWSDSARDRRIVRIGTQDGLYDEAIHRILADDAGRLWMNTNRGIFWVPRAELVAFAEGRAREVHSTAYTERDGLRNREGNGGVQSAGTRTRDGRLWFPTQDGVAIVDPRTVTARRVTPPAVVERIVAGDSAIIPSGEPVEVGVGGRNLAIEYTALSLLEPKNLRFRYRLEPYDPDWVDAGNRRVAFYTRVPPGSYTFRVQAASPDAEFALVGGELPISLAFQPWETWTFRVGLALALLAAAAGGAVLWSRGVRRRAEELELVVADRTSALRQREQQLAHQNLRLYELDQAKSRFFANASHELRTPLTLILGPLRSLLDGRHGALPPSAREQGELMLRNTGRLLRLVNQILDLTRLQEKAVQLNRRPGDLVAFARTSTLAFAPLAERRGITLRFHSAVGQLPLVFDDEQLEKVLLNLISNALKFTEALGSVDVSVEVDGATAVLAVGDTGIGIAPHELPHVFERFYQADSSATRRYEGTGIGLALAKELVELHGGELSATSERGAGSTFTVRLPLGDAVELPVDHGPVLGRVERTRDVASPRAEALAITPAGDAGSLPAIDEEELSEDRTTVLVVDDNADVRAYVRSILSASYRVLEAGDGRAGLETALASVPDLVVADVMMPEMDGLALGRALKADAMTDTIPVVLLTARAAPEDHVAGLEVGVDAYLVKPFDPGVLEACVANLLAQRQRLRERFRQGEIAPPSTTPAEPHALDRRLRPLVEARLADPELSADTLAADAGLTYQQLYRALREELDTTPTRYIRFVRAECAAELLRRGEGSVTEVCYAVGFASLSYFRRAFRERYGTTPSAHLAAGPSPKGSVARSAGGGS